MRREIPTIGGTVAPGFEAVRDAFVANFTDRHELGGACCVVRHGERIVDLWGGLRDRTTKRPFEPDTMAILHSTTKGLAAMVVALAHSRGWLDYEAPVGTYWPELARDGKEHLTMRQLLAHQGGLWAFDEHVDREVLADLDRLAGVMARQRPLTTPGDEQAYHAITLGFYEAEILRRVDPAHRTLGRIFDDEIARPLGLDVLLRVPESLPDERIAPLERPSTWDVLTGLGPKFLVESTLRRHSVVHRSLVENPGTGFYVAPERVIARELEAPSGLGIGSARGIAAAYGAFATGGRALGLRPETIAALEAPARPARVTGFFDGCLHAEAKFSLGFMKPSVTFPFGSDRAYGAPGAGGSIGFAEPETGVGYAYVTSRMGTTLTGDPRDLALRAAMPELFRRPEAA